MRIWVDADACPGVIKDILFRAAVRTKTCTILVANHGMKIPSSEYVRFLHVTHGFDVADNEIVQRLDSGDLVITSDIPLASEAIDMGALALNPRGELYTSDNIKARLSMRDFMDSLRSSGIDTGGPTKLSQANRQSFANQLDKILNQNQRNDD